MRHQARRRTRTSRDRVDVAGSLRYCAAGRPGSGPSFLRVRWPLLLLAALLLLSLALVAAAWVRRRRLKQVVPAREAPRLRHAVVLAHGALGFDEIVVAGRRHRYFRNISERLAAPGAD